jgi:hypothetical protein
MSTRWIAWTLALGLALPGGAAAQESAQPRVLFEILTWKVEPADAPAFEAAVRKIVAAATEAKLSRSYGWFFYNELYDYTLVYPVKNMAYFDDPQQWERQFQGTPGEKMLGEAFQAFGDLRYRIVEHEVLEEVADWSYAPASPPAQAPWAHVDNFWVKPGKEQQFDALTKEFVQFVKENGYAYAVDGHRVHFGDQQKTVFVTFFDSKDAFYGRNGLDALVTRKKVQEKWADMIRRLSLVVSDIEHFDSRYRPDLSYWPEG